LAVKKTIEIEAKLDDAIKGVENLNKQMEGLVDSQKESVDQAKAQTKSLGVLGKGLKALRGGLKGVGLALKALGVGLVIEAFNLLREIFSQNQKVVDFFTTSFNALSLAFNDFFNFIQDNVGVVINYFKDLFENPVENIKAFGDALQNYFVNAFEQALNAAEAFGMAIQALFRGDFAIAGELAKEGLSELTDAFVGVEEGGVQILKDSLNGLVDGVKDYTKSIIESAKEQTKLTNAAVLAQAVNEGLIEKYDRQAEQLRQIRDDEEQTIAVRKAANEELSAVLEEQEKAMLANQRAIIASAQAEYDRNATIENQAELIRARNELLGIEAQIEGFRSEQLSNRNALLREERDLANSIAEGEAERSIEQARFDAEFIESTVARLEALRSVADEEAKIEKERLETQLSNLNEGTQMYIDTQNELLAFNKENARITKQLDRDIADAKVATVLTAAGQIASLVGEQTMFGKGLAVASAIIDTYAGATKAFAQGGIFGGIAGAGIIAAGLANVRQIVQTEVPDSPFGGGGGRGSMPTPSFPTPPSVNFNTLQGGFNQLENAIGLNNEVPVKAYVTTQDINSANQLDRKVTSQSIFE